MLQILKNTDLAAYYEEHPFDVFTFFHPFDALSRTSTTVPFGNFVITE